MRRRACNGPVAAIVGALVKPQGFDFAAAEYCGLSGRLVDALDCECLVAGGRLDRCADTLVKCQCFVDVHCRYIGQINAVQFSELSVTDVEARIRRQELVSGRETADKLIDGYPEGSNPKECPIHKCGKGIDGTLIRRADRDQYPSD